MARSIRLFDRKAPRFKPQPKVLILCEDSKSGKRYLEEAAFHFRANAQVEIAHCGITHPSGIVKTAIARQKGFDKVFCALDRDMHLCFERAIDLAAISGEANPSTEIHLLMDEFESLSKPQPI
jgi:hypothetical protein